MFNNLDRQFNPHSLERPTDDGYQDPELDDSELRELAQTRIMALSLSGIQYSEAESRRIILADCPECPDWLMEDILQELGF